MKLKITAFLLIFMLVLSAAGCKAKDSEEMGSLGEYNGTINTDENSGSTNQPSVDSNAGNDLSNGGSSDSANQPSVGGNTNNSTVQTPAGNTQGNPQGNNQTQNNGQGNSQGATQNKPNHGTTQNNNPNNSQGNGVGNTAGSNQGNAQTNTPNQNKPQSGTQQKPQGNGNAGGSTTKPNAGSNSNAVGGEESSGSGNAGQGSALEILDAAKAIAVAAGDTICYGPASTAQQQQLTFTDAAGNATQVEISGVQKVATFGDGFVIYSYKAPAAGSVSIAVGEKHKGLFIAAKGAMDINEFYRYWDNQQGRNLYDAGLDKSSKWINNAGKAQDSELGGVTHAIPVTAGETISFGPVSPGKVLGYGYDASMAPMDMLNAYHLKEAFSFAQGMRAYTYTVPEGVSYVRLNVGAEEAQVFAITKNDELNQTKYRQLTGADPDMVEDPLYHKECLFVGDSLCSAAQDTKIDGQRGWARRVKELSGAYSSNGGRGGAALSNARMDKDDGSGYHMIYNQIKRFPDKTFDYILLEGGGNDAWSTAPIGKPSDGYDPTFFDLSTYAGGLEMAIYTAITEYGDTAAIGYMMTFQMPRNTHGVIATKMGEYYEMGKQICDKWNITYLDMYNNEEINNKLNPMSTEHVPDGTHADDSGYDILGPYITEYMRSMTPATKQVLDALAEIE